MAGFAGAELAGAVARAGGFGFIGAGDVKLLKGAPASAWPCQP